MINTDFFKTTIQENDTRIPRPEDPRWGRRAGHRYEIYPTEQGLLIIREFVLILIKSVSLCVELLNRGVIACLN
jgi:hypothetical protein